MKAVFVAMLVACASFNGVTLAGEASDWFVVGGEADLDKASGIFVARVLRSEIIDLGSGIEQVEIKYELQESIKGSQRRVGILKTALVTTGFAFTTGFSYLIVLYDSEYVGCCGGTRLLLFPLDDESSEYLDAVRAEVKAGVPGTDH